LIIILLVVLMLSDEEIIDLEIQLRQKSKK